MKLLRLYIPIAPAAYQAGNRFSQARYAIQLAAAKGDTVKLIELLIHYPRRASDALYWAAGNGRIHTVAALLSHGATTTAKAVVAAESNNHYYIVEILRNQSKNQKREVVCQAISDI